MAMQALRGFSLKNPKHWIYYPVFCWLGAIGWFYIEKLFGG
jgi:hypothetical protein